MYWMACKIQENFSKMTKKKGGEDFYPLSQQRPILNASKEERKRCLGVVSPCLCSL